MILILGSVGRPFGVAWLSGRTGVRWETGSGVNRSPGPANGFPRYRDARTEGHRRVACDRIREKDFPVVMITAYGSIDLAVEAMKEGAYDFVPKPFKPSHIALVVEKAMERQRLRRERKYFPKKSTSVTALSPVIAQNLTRPSAAQRRPQGAVYDFTIGGERDRQRAFRQGDSQLERKKARPFIAINCVGLSKELLESELFGYEKGAFTGASQLKRGKIEIGNGGTVFLDEVGDISEELQLSCCDSCRSGSLSGWAAPSSFGST